MLAKQRRLILAASTLPVVVAVVIRNTNTKATPSETDVRPADPEELTYDADPAEERGPCRHGVDFVRRRVLVRESVTEIFGRSVRTWTKAYQERQVPLPPSLVLALTAHLGTHLGGADDAPVFRGPHGGELRYRAFHGRVWSPTLKTLGLPTSGFMFCVIPGRLG